MTQISQQDTAQIVARYLAVWSEPDPASRRAAIAGLWAGDGCEFVEGTRFRGTRNSAPGSRLPTRSSWAAAGTP